MTEVCVDSRMAFHSGIGTYIRNILPFLKNSFTAVRVLAPVSFIEKWPELETYDLIPVQSAPYTLQEQLELPLRIPRCDLYWTPHYNIPVFPIRAKKRLTTIHDIYHLVYGSPLQRLYAKAMFKSAAHHSDHIITISNFSLNEIVRCTKTSPQKISLIHNGVNTSHFSFPAPAATVERVRSVYDLPDNYFLFVSTLASHKNLARLLRAWARVLRNHPDWSLVVVGKRVKNTDYLKVLCEFPYLESKVRFLGEVQDDELPSLYQLACALISPSYYEGFGLTPLEAMAMRCPAIVSKAASFPEICEDAALYVNPFDEEDIAQKISQLINEPLLRQSLIDKGVKRIDLFPWEKTAEEHIRIMHQLKR